MKSRMILVGLLMISACAGITSVNASPRVVVEYDNPADIYLHATDVFGHAYVLTVNSVACLDYSVPEVMVNKIGYHQFVYPLTNGVHQRLTTSGNSPPAKVIM